MRVNPPPVDSPDNEPKRIEEPGAAAARRSAVLEEKRHVSAKISDLTRYIGFGLVAVCYAIVTSESATTQSLYGDQPRLLLLAAGLGSLSIVLDYLQFLGGYFAVNTALKNVDGGFKYNSDSLAYKVRRFCYAAKQFAAMAGAICFCVAVAKSIL